MEYSYVKSNSSLTRLELSVYLFLYLHPCLYPCLSLFLSLYIYISLHPSIHNFKFFDIYVSFNIYIDISIDMLCAEQDLYLCLYLILQIYICISLFYIIICRCLFSTFSCIDLFWKNCIESNISFSRLIYLYHRLR